MEFVSLRQSALTHVSVSNGYFSVLNQMFGYNEILTPSHVIAVDMLIAARHMHIYGFVIISDEMYNEFNHIEPAHCIIALVESSAPKLSKMSTLYVICSPDKLFQIEYTDQTIDSAYSQQFPDADFLSNPPFGQMDMNQLSTQESRFDTPVLPSFLSPDIRELLVTDAMANQNVSLELEYHPKRLRHEGDKLLGMVAEAYLLSKYSTIMADGLTTQLSALVDRTALASYYDVCGYEVLNLNLRSEKQKEMIVETHIGALRIMRSFRDAVEQCIHIIEKLTDDKLARDSVLDYFYCEPPTL